jgi:hypothetical protein
MADPAPGEEAPVRATPGADPPAPAPTVASPLELAQQAASPFASAAWNKSRRTGDWASMPMSQSLIGKGLRLNLQSICSAVWLALNMQIRVEHVACPTMTVLLTFLGNSDRVQLR